jgi:hypothetical protein
VAIGNVVRGVPLNGDGYFSLPLFNILNWYALLVGVFGLVVLATHGATFLAYRARGRVRERAARIGRRLWWAEVLLFLGLIGPTYGVREGMLENLGEHPWTLVFPLLAAAGSRGASPLPASAAVESRLPIRTRRQPEQPYRRQCRCRQLRARGGDRVAARGGVLRIRVPAVLPSPLT